ADQIVMIARLAKGTTLSVTLLRAFHPAKPMSQPACFVWALAHYNHGVPLAGTCGIKSVLS
ncbi:MAG: hypothetical protein ABL858_00585, partial [Candidatus Nitrotoga sp.]